MSLQDGEIHESDASNSNLYRKMVFKRHRITMDAEQFSFQQSNPGGSRGERELSTYAMRSIVDSLLLLKEGAEKSLANDTQRYFHTGDTQPSPIPGRHSRSKDLIYQSVLNKINNAKNILLSDFNRIDYLQNEINKYLVEIYKKYAIPVACVVFILIGAPLGTMTKKGGCSFFLFTGHV
jgi:lipopolysaccharide export system permease protein